MEQDVKGIPICPGDLLRSFHYIGARRKRHFLYHVAVLENDTLFAVPTSHLEPTKRNDGGKCRVKDMCDHTEIIHGYGPMPYISFEDRPRGASRRQAGKGGEQHEAS